MKQLSTPQKSYICGKGFVVDIGVLSPEKLNELKNMSEEARQIALNKMLETLPDDLKIWDGFCTKTKKYVKVSDCIKCARDSGITSTKDWEVCRVNFISKGV
jgi:hypothetical protein